VSQTTEIGSDNLRCTRIAILNCINLNISSFAKAAGLLLPMLNWVLQWLQVIPAIVTKYGCSVLPDQLLKVVNASLLPQASAVTAAGTVNENVPGVVYVGVVCEKIIEEINSITQATIKERITFPLLPEKIKADLLIEKPFLIFKEITER